MNTIIKIPNYKVDFELDIDYSYSSGKENVRDLLIETSKGYCMYCYSKISNDKKNYGHLEHTIEKKIAPGLIECHQNLSIACPTCNTSFKAREYKERKIVISSVFNCSNKVDNCQNYCQSYHQVAVKYMENMIQKNLKKILLKPHIIVNNNRRNIKFEIIYDLLEFKFKPFDNKYYSNIDREYIESHINKFELNDEKYSTDAIFEVLEDFMYYKQIPREGRYSNWVADLFIEKLKHIEESQGIQEVEKFCSLLNLRKTLKFK